MALNDAFYKKLWLISDTILYPEAVIFMRELADDEEVKHLPDNNQVMGLLNIVENARYSHIIDYIRHQIDRKVDKIFYERLFQALRAMQQKRLQEEFQLVTAPPTKQEMDELMLLLAREFIQHIIAEHGMLKPDN